jgi:hypothetical protein
MNFERLLQHLATSVIGLAFGTLVGAFFIKCSLRLTARMLGTPIQPFSPARTFGAAACLSLVSQLIGGAFELIGSGAMMAPGVTIANERIPMLWFIARPLEFFLLAGLMIRFLPTTALRGTLISINFQILSTALLAVIVAAAALFG